MSKTLRLGIRETLELLKGENPNVDLVFKTEVPAFRSFDISRGVDLVEEILRIYGYTNVSPQRPFLPANRDIEKPFEEKVRNLLTDRGLNEVITFPWLEERLVRLFNLSPVWEVVNPLNAEQRFLRTSIVPSLIKVQLFNQNNFKRNLALFEIGKVYAEGERPVLGLLAVGYLNEHFEGSLRWDFLKFKGSLEAILNRFGVRAKVKILKKGYMHPYLCAGLEAEGKSLGYFGKLHPEIAEELELQDTPFVAEIYLDTLKEVSQKPHYKPISKFPPVKRDFAFLFEEESGKVQELLDIAKRVFGELLEELYIFDVYKGEKLGEGKVSVALRVILRSPERSLSDEEVNRLSERFIKAAEERGFALRV